MRIHTKLSAMHLINAAHEVGVTMARISVHGSRTHARAIEVNLSGSGRTGGQWGTARNQDGAEYKAATWDEWGMFLARVFAQDHSARVPGAYRDADHFRWSTNGRFGGWTQEAEAGGDFVPSDLTRETQHLQHKWTHDGVSLGGSYTTHKCTKCDARTRRLLHSTWEDFSA